MAISFAEDYQSEIAQLETDNESLERALDGLYSEINNLHAELMDRDDAIEDLQRQLAECRGV